MLSCDVVVLI